MPGTHVRIRIPATGLLADELLEPHPRARVTCIEVGRRQTEVGLVVDHFALAEGVPDRTLDALVRAWNEKYQQQATTLGTPFALRLSLPLSHVTTPGIVTLHRTDFGSALPIGHVLHAGSCDFWISCGTPEAAKQLAVHLHDHLRPEVHAHVAAGDPNEVDSECWEALRLAAEVNPGLAVR